MKYIAYKYFSQNIVGYYITVLLKHEQNCFPFIPFDILLFWDAQIQGVKF